MALPSGLARMPTHDVAGGEHQVPWPMEVVGVACVRTNDLPQAEAAVWTGPGVHAEAAAKHEPSQPKIDVLAFQ
jgi:hypothetical protein